MQGGARKGSRGKVAGRGTQSLRERPRRPGLNDGRALGRPPGNLEARRVRLQSKDPVRWMGDAPIAGSAVHGSSDWDNGYVSLTHVLRMYYPLEMASCWHTQEAASSWHLGLQDLSVASRPANGVEQHIDDASAASCLIWTAPIALFAGAPSAVLPVLPGDKSEAALASASSSLCRV